MNRLGRLALWFPAVLVCFFLLAPLLIVFPLSLSSSPFLVFPPPSYTLHWYRVFFADPNWTHALVRSIEVAVSVIIISVVLGTITAYGIARSGRAKLVKILNPVLLIPMIIPALVFAVAAYVIAVKLRLIGGLWIVVVGHVILAIPFVIINLGAAFQTTDARLEMAAQTMGASRLRSFVSITLPLIIPALVASAVLAAMLSLDETVFALFMTPATAPTLPVQMYSAIQFDLSPLVPVASSVMLVGSLILGGIGLILYRVSLRRLHVASKRPEIAEALAQPASTAEVEPGLLAETYSGNGAK
jgi:ABC-type spermidine/putrescine transport system permease subunit II